MRKYGTTKVLMDEIEIEYLLSLVEIDQERDGAFIGVEVMGLLIESLGLAQENR